MQRAYLGDTASLPREATKTTAAAATGYRAGMYGEIGVGLFPANIGPEQQFGRFAPESTTGFFPVVGGAA
jgi:hypothetical protein